MPLRIAIAGAIAIAACIVVPVSVSAVSSGNDGTGASAEDAEPPEPDPGTAETRTVATDRSFAGARIESSASSINAGYSAVKSWPVLLVLIAMGFVPAGFMIARSASRRRAGPVPDGP